MSTEKARWLGLGVPVLLLVGLVIAIGLHIGLARQWSELVVPVAAYVGLQVATYTCMFWARARSRTKGDYRAAVALAGFYAWGSGFWLIHYGPKWGLLHVRTDDEMGFTVFAIVCVAITFGLLSIFKQRLASRK
jgi:hypothetical protein